MFKLNSHINRHNFVYWSDVNPNVILEKDVNLPGVTVWVVISVTGIIGSVFFDGTVNQNNYLHGLQTEFWPRVEHKVGVYFQQDGAPPHYAQRMVGHAFRRAMDRATWATGVAGSIPRPNAARFLFVACP
jgi:hypothetical protein